MATPTAIASTRLSNEISRRGPPAGGPFLFGSDRAQQRARVVVVPDQGCQVVPVGLNGHRLFVDIEIDILKRPAPQLAVAKGSLQPAVVVSPAENSPEADS